MSNQGLSNVKIADFREFLQKCGCKKISTKGGHEKWSRRNLTRPVIFQTHEEPVPEFIVRNALRSLELTRKDFFNILFDVK
jgi:hypothetical protein